MRYGLIADTHDNIGAIRQALKEFETHQVDRILHLGDLCQAEIAWEFSGAPVSYILGNNELEVVHLRKAVEAAGMEFLGEQAELKLNGISICLYHGTRQATLDRLIASQQYDYLLKGHSHYVEDYQSGRTRILNPGALWRAEEYSIAVFEPLKDKFQLIELPKPKQKMYPY